MQKCAIVRVCFLGGGGASELNDSFDSNPFSCVLNELILLAASIHCIANSIDTMYWFFIIGSLFLCL